MPLVGDRFYTVRPSKRSQHWDVVWTRHSRDKPVISRWLKVGGREVEEATFAKREWADEYIEILSSGNEERFSCRDV